MEEKSAATKKRISYLFLNKLGEILIENGKIDLAISLFKKAINSCKWENLKNVVFFGTLTEDNVKDHLIKFYLNCYYNNLGEAYCKKKEFKKAIDYYMKIDDPNNILEEDAHLSIADCYIQMNKIDEAMKVLINIYRIYTSKKSFDLLKSLYKKRHGNLANFSAYIKDTSHSNAVYDNIRNINFLSNYKDKIVILGLHKSSCSACLKLLLVLRKLEKKFSLNENVIFINLFSENEHNLVMNSIKVDKSLYRTMIDELNVNALPYVLLVDKKGHIRYRMTGFNEHKNYIKNLKSKINSLLEEK